MVTSLKVTVFQVVDMVSLKLLDVHHIATTYLVTSLKVTVFQAVDMVRLKLVSSPHLNTYLLHMAGQGS